MTNNCNTEEITPVREEPSQKDPAQEHSAQSQFGRGSNPQAKSEQKDAAVGVIQGTDDQDERGDEKNEDDASNSNPEHKMDDKDFSVFTHNEKKIIVLCAGICSFFSPISGQIYFPSLDAIATDLHVSYTLVNLTITTYLVSDFVRSRSKPTY